MGGGQTDGGWGRGAEGGRVVVVIDDPSTASVINGRNKMYQVTGGCLVKSEFVLGLVLQRLSLIHI